jgi:acyl carrier protein
MKPLTRTEISRMMTEILTRQGRTGPQSEDTPLRDIGFRSLDFSELALRCEMESGGTLEFEASALRNIQTVRDVLDYLEKSIVPGS